ncbi:MAG: hypothetical protein ACI9UQ_001121 [Candidatus Krumholzibacteriia bacterium]|jgi:hypothetical protein
MFSKKLLLAGLVTLTMVATMGVAATSLAHGDEQGHSAHGEKSPAAFETMVGDYLFIQTALAGDSLKMVEKHAAAIAKSARALEKEFSIEAAGIEEKDAENLRKILPELAASATAFAKAKDIEAARKSFAPLSSAMVSYRNMMTGEVPNVAYCPMVKESWLQNGKNIANPYYGSKMLRCGSIVTE